MPENTAKAKGKPVRLSQVEMTELVLPPDTNNLGTAFGGKVAQWIDMCAGIAAVRHCRTTVVTASMDDLHFLTPIHQGEIVTLQASVNRAFRTSMEIGVRIDAENPLTGERRHCTSAHLTFVALDAKGDKLPVPPVIPETKAEKRRYEEAALRRQERLGRRKREQAHFAKYGE